MEEQERMKQLQVIAAGVCVLGLAGSAGAAVAAGHKLNAAMTPQQVVTPAGKQWQVPAAVAHATGTFSATVSTDNRRLAWRISYAKLGRPSLVIADIHVG